MQALISSIPSISTLSPSKIYIAQIIYTPSMVCSRCPSIKATPISSDGTTVDYSSLTSVFPAEACDTIGGEACNAEMFPETKLVQEDAINKGITAQESVDREYIEYDEAKTVFPGEACDDLGGEFCQPEYQSGVFKEVPE